MEAPGLEEIRAAAARLKGAIEHTPCLHSRTLSLLTGAEVFLKFENLQFTASFKERGALNRLLALSAAERGRGVIAMSAGNHAQAVAYHAARLGIRAVIVMPRGSPNSKVRNTAGKYSATPPHTITGSSNPPISRIRSAIEWMHPSATSSRVAPRRSCWRISVVEKTEQ